MFLVDKNTSFFFLLLLLGRPLSSKEDRVELSAANNTNNLWGNTNALGESKV